MRTLPIYGRGVAFPFRRDLITGGVQVSEGLSDPSTVDLAYIREDFTIREDITGPQNHIAESIAHILLCRLLEHDTLPQFGSDIFNIIKEPNNPQFWALAANYFQFAAAKWEHRAQVPPDGVEWSPTALGIQRGELPVKVSPAFIKNQVEGNLVAPFYSPREARDYTYPMGDVDDSGHDYPSRYFGNARAERDGIDYNRLRTAQNVPFARDDQFYEVVFGDSWLLISFRVYQDIRFWPYISEMYAQDRATEGLSRSNMDPCNDPTIGDVIRVPSRTRMLTEIATMRG